MNQLIVFILIAITVGCHSSEECFQLCRTYGQYDCLAEKVQEELKDQINNLAVQVPTCEENLKNTQTDLEDCKAVKPYDYIVTETTQNWEESRKVCQELGGDLAVNIVKHVEERSALLERMAVDKRLWIGMNDIATEGQFEYVDGTDATATGPLWNKEGGSDGGTIENCVEIYNIGYINHLNDRVCADALIALCEIPK